MTQWTNPEQVGYLPMIFREDDLRTAQEQAAANYAHGGGWMSFQGFELVSRGPAEPLALQYPGDPPMRELSRTNFHSGLLVLFESSWLAIIDPQGNMTDVARID